MSEPLSKEVEIRNKRGLHARASAKFCAVAGSFDAEIKVSREGTEVNGNSIMGLMMLGAGIGTTIVITTRGAQADEALDTLVNLVVDKFGEGE